MERSGDAVTGSVLRLHISVGGAASGVPRGGGRGTGGAAAAAGGDGSGACGSSGRRPARPDAIDLTGIANNSKSGDAGHAGAVRVVGAGSWSGAAGIVPRLDVTSAALACGPPPPSPRSPASTRGMQALTTLVHTPSSDGRHDGLATVGAGGGGGGGGGGARALAASAGGVPVDEFTCTLAPAVAGGGAARQTMAARRCTGMASRAVAGAGGDARQHVPLPYGGAEAAGGGECVSLFCCVGLCGCLRHA